MANIYESLIVYKSDTNEVVALIPLKFGETAIVKDGYNAKIILDTEVNIYEEGGNKIIYKGGTK